MDRTTTLVCFILSLIQTAESQPNLAAMLGLGFGDIAESQTPGSGSCPYRAHPDRRKFSQTVNNRVMTQECAPGTMFVLSKCSCDNIPTGGPPGGAMPGTNPRLESTFGGGSNQLLSALLSQLQGGGAPSPPTQSPRSMHNRSPMSTNKLNTFRQKVTSGVRPDQQSRGNDRKASQEPQSAQPIGMQYNPDPSTGLTAVVDPSVLPDVLPPEILKVLGRTSNKERTSGNSKPSAPTRASSETQRLPASVQEMLNRATKPQTSRKSVAPTKSTSNDLGGMALPPGGLPSDVLKMLRQSIQPPANTDRRRNSNAGNQKSPRLTTQTPRSQRTPSPSQKRTQSPSRKTGSRQDPLADLMAQLQGKQGQQKGPKRSGSAPSQPRQDPLAALLAGVSHSPRRPTRGPSRGATRSPSWSPTRAPQPGRTRGSGGPPGGDPLAALMAGIGGGTSSGSDPLAALMASVGGSSPGGGNNALAALLGGSAAGPGTPGSSGGALSLSSLPANMNLASLFGETSGTGPGRTVDLTNFFNAQGLAGGTAALAGANNIDFLKLQQMDRRGVIDLGDLTLGGMIAANKHFSG